MSTSPKHGPEFDEVNYWSEIKLEIVKKYAKAYTTAFRNRSFLKKCYIDGFAGPGVHISKSTGEYIPGSPLNAFFVNPPFDEYYFIDLDGEKAEHLKSLLDGDGKHNTKVHSGNSNEILTKQILPTIKYKDYRRGLCLLDPYGLHLNWEVLKLAGQLKTIEIFLNFPIMDMNRNVLWHNPEKVEPDQEARMTAFWGDDSWRKAAYTVDEVPLFDLPIPEKLDNDAVVKAFQTRLKEVAGFKYVPEPMPMRNSTNAVVYYLFFAGPNNTGGKIVKDIFDTYKNRAN